MLHSIFVICCAVMAFIFSGTGIRAENAPPPPGDNTNSARIVFSQPLNAEKMIGKWKRSDGDYLFEITRKENSDTFNIGYYNPQPVHIAQASVSSEKAEVRLTVRLEDKGYPGSTYTLDYLEKQDLLEGIYYHAGLQQTFPVTFGRIKSPPPSAQ
ncbi:MAG: hypothetical protein D3906_15530 [Candidatus Electrothrix sp. AUS1_2]|nr:hypothetical protein [Candidatus Electrothrix sp. AUS1_2]